MTLNKLNHCTTLHICVILVLYGATYEAWFDEFLSYKSAELYLRAQH